jgi:hypothetical protein
MRLFAIAIFALTLLAAGASLMAEDKVTPPHGETAAH